MSDKDRPLSIRMASSTVKLLKKTAARETSEKIASWLEKQAFLKIKNERQIILDLVAAIRRIEWTD